MNSKPGDPVLVKDTSTSITSDDVIPEPRNPFSFEFQGEQYRIHWPEDVEIITWESRGTKGSIRFACGFFLKEVPISVCKELSAHISNYRGQEL